MRAEEILQRRFEVELAGIHVARVRLMFTAVYTLLRSGRLSLTSLGRAIAATTTPKHGIKRIDRLLGNSHLHRERVDFYRAIARRLVQPGSRPLVIVDWTAITTELWALVAAVPYEGRALIIYAETHGIRSYMKPFVNEAFLESVKAVLPACKPIIVTDAGFRTPWMKLVLSYGWDYICRVRGLNLIRSAKDEAWCDVERLWKMTSAGPSELGSYDIWPKVTVSHSYRRRPEEAEIPVMSREARRPLRAAEASRTRAMDSRNVADRVGQEGGHDVRAPHADRGDVSRHEKPPLRDRPEVTPGRGPRRAPTCSSCSRPTRMCSTCCLDSLRKRLASREDSRRTQSRTDGFFRWHCSGDLCSRNTGTACSNSRYPMKAWICSASGLSRSMPADSRGSVRPRAQPVTRRANLRARAHGRFPASGGLSSEPTRRRGVRAPEVQSLIFGT